MDFVLSLLFIFLISLLSILLLVPVAEKVGLVARRDWRRQHEGAPALIGGLSVYAGMLVGISQFITPSSSSLTYLLCSAILVVLGVMDDKKELSAKLRLLVQAVVAVLMCWGSGLAIVDLGDILGLGFALRLPDWLGYAVTVVAVIAAINAFNMLDGIDGLLGLTSLATFLGMAVLFFLNGDKDGMWLALIVAVALLPYLAANLGVPAVKVKKVFMGDTGSMLIGFTVVWLLLQGSQVASPVTGSPAFGAAAALWLIALPLMDMVRVMGVRFARTGSLSAMLKADRSHLHHVLLDNYGYDKHTVLRKICALSVFFVLTGVLMQVNGVKEVIMFSVFLIGFVAYAYRIGKVSKKASI